MRESFRGAVTNLEQEAAYVHRRDPAHAALLRKRADEMRVPPIDCTQIPPGE